jgi:CRP-like cAMP-binding protein
VTVAAQLLRTPVFADLSPQDFETLLPDVSERRYGRGEVVWLEGDAAESLYVVAEGQLKAFRVSRDGAEVILGFSSSGDVMGEVGLFHPTGRRQVSVSAMQPSRCLTIPRAPLLAFMAAHPVTMERMLQRLSTITVRAAYSFTGVAFEDIRRRVAGALLALASEFGEEVADGTRIRLQLSQGALAALVAASRENVNRALSTFVSSDAVIQRDGHFVVRDWAALRQLRDGDELRDV